MADPNLEEIPDFASPVYEAIRNTLRMAHANEDDQQAVEHLTTAWQANRAARVAAWNAQKEAEACADEEAAQERRQEEEEEERRAAEEAEREQREAEKKKTKMNTFTPGTSVADVLELPPSQYALQKLSSFEWVELWYFTLEGCLDAAKHFRSHADDAFGISRLNDYLTVRSIASVRASSNAIPDELLSFSKFLRAKNCFLEHARKAEWPTMNLDALAKFFWFLETHPTLQLPLRETIILTYALHVRSDWHRELKAGRGYDISVTNHHLMSTITAEIERLDNHRVKSQASTPPLSSLSSPLSHMTPSLLCLIHARCISYHHV